MNEEIPDVNIIRNRIRKASPEQAKYSLMSAYLFCARVSEIVGTKCPSDIGTTPRGVKGTSLNYDTVLWRDQDIEAAVFTVRTAKRDGKIRKVALPLDAKFEPFTKSLVKYFERYDNSFVFPFNRQVMHSYARKLFTRLTYQIEPYKHKDEQGKKQTIHTHDRKFATHALRHLRAAELMEHYGFDGIDLSTYGGWTLRSAVGIGSSLGRYAHLNWRRYFPKLLKKRRA